MRTVEMCLRCKAFILVMLTAEFRYLDNRANGGDLARKRTLLVEAQMGSGSVIVRRNTEAAERRLVEKAVAVVAGWRYGCST